MSNAVHIAKQIKLQIKSGIYQPGDKLPKESELSLSFKAGRNTIREAIARLRYAKLIYTRQGSGTYVSDHLESDLFGSIEQMPLIDEIVMVYDYRIALESTAATIAAQQATKKQRAELVSLNQDIHTAIVENTSGTISDIRFHQLIMQTTNNHMFIETFSNYQQSFERVIHAARVNSGTTPEHMQAAYDEHLKIVHAINIGDQVFAGQAMSVHLNGAKQRLIASAANNNE